MQQNQSGPPPLVAVKNHSPKVLKAENSGTLTGRDLGLTEYILIHQRSRDVS